MAKTYQELVAELRGTLPKLPLPFAKTLVERAYKNIRNRNFWSFQLQEGQWISPGQISAGTATTVQGSANVVFDPIADAAINANGSSTYSFITQRQFRIASGGIYNIYNYQTSCVNSITLLTGGTYSSVPIITISGGGGSGATAVPIMNTTFTTVIGIQITNFGTGYTSIPTVTFTGGGGFPQATASATYGGLMTLDRFYGEPSATDAAYAIYQVYYAAPVKDFLSFISVRDMQNFIDLYIDRTRQELDATDPQRTWYYFPTWVVPYKTDPNPVSATYGYMLYELWGAPTYNLNYQLMYLREGPALVNPTDTLPQAIGDDCVMALARVYAYEWAEANKGQTEIYRQSPDYKFLMGIAQKEYEYLLKLYRKQDREVVDNWFSVGRSSLYGKFWSYYNSIGKTAYPGM